MKKKPPKMYCAMCAPHYFHWDSVIRHIRHNGKCAGCGKKRTVYGR